MNTEAQKGKTEPDGHGSYVGRQFGKYVSSVENILSEEKVFEALCFGGGIANSTPVLRI